MTKHRMLNVIPYCFGKYKVTNYKNETNIEINEIYNNGLTTVVLPVFLIKGFFGAKCIIRQWIPENGRRQHN